MSSLRRIAATLLRVMREIFEESAYERFLLRHRLVSSRESYKQFLREAETVKARRPRCC